MNKEIFIKTLSKKLNYDEQKCTIINSIIEDTFIIGKNNKEKMIDKFINELKVSTAEANKIYEASMETISSAIKDKIKHPFNID